MPYTIADTQVNRRLPDSLLISDKIFAQFVPDTLYTKDYGKKAKPKFYALGKIVDPEKETYLLVKAATSEKQVAYILCFDKGKIFKAAMLLVKNNSDRNKSLSGSIDKRFTITTSETKKAPDGQRYYKLNAYVYNSEGVFTLIKIESNEPVLPTSIYNPIDTLPVKNKLSGDYVQNKRNFVSVRDGKSAKHILFFVHFDRERRSVQENKRRGGADKTQYSAIPPGRGCVCFFNCYSLGIKSPLVKSRVAVTTGVSNVLLKEPLQKERSTKSKTEEKIMIKPVICKKTQAL